MCSMRVNDWARAVVAFLTSFMRDSLSLFSLVHRCFVVHDRSLPARQRSRYLRRRERNYWTLVHPVLRYRCPGRYDGVSDDAGASDGFVSPRVPRTGSRSGTSWLATRRASFSRSPMPSLRKIPVRCAFTVRSVIASCRAICLLVLTRADQRRDLAFSLRKFGEMPGGHRLRLHMFPQRRAQFIEQPRRNGATNPQFPSSTATTTRLRSCGSRS